MEHWLKTGRHFVLENPDTDPRIFGILQLINDKVPVQKDLSE